MIGMSIGPLGPGLDLVADRELAQHVQVLAQRVEQRLALGVVCGRNQPGLAGGGHLGVLSVVRREAGPRPLRERGTVVRLG